MTRWSPKLVILPVAAGRHVDPVGESAGASARFRTESIGLAPSASRSSPRVERGDVPRGPERWGVSLLSGAFAFPAPQWLLFWREQRAPAFFLPPHGADSTGHHGCRSQPSGSVSGAGGGEWALACLVFAANRGGGETGGPVSSKRLRSGCPATLRLRTAFLGAGCIRSQSRTRRCWNRMPSGRGTEPVLPAFDLPFGRRCLELRAIGGSGLPCLLRGGRPSSGPTAA